MPINIDLSKNAGFIRLSEKRDIKRNTEVIENLITIGKLSFEEIANAVNVSLEFVKQIADKLNNKP